MTPHTHRDTIRECTVAFFMLVYSFTLLWAALKGGYALQLWMDRAGTLATAPLAVLGPLLGYRGWKHSIYYKNGEGEVRNGGAGEDNRVNDH